MSSSVYEKQVNFGTIEHNENYLSYEQLKVTSNLRGCPPEKNSYACCFEGNPTNYISIESL